MNCTTTDFFTWLNAYSNLIIGLATVFLVIATFWYVRLVYRQLRLGEANVFPYVASRNGRPFVYVTNAGVATAYRVFIRINWPEPPAPVSGVPVSVESPEFGKLTQGEIIPFESPHEIIAINHLKNPEDYQVKVLIEYNSFGDKHKKSNEVILKFGHHFVQMRKSRIKYK